MELDNDEMFDESPLKIYSSKLASQDKMVIRIRKLEQDVDVESKDLSSDQEETVSYTCEFVQKVDESKSEFDDLCDEPIESVRQDENFIYPMITNSDEEDVNDATWLPPSILAPSERASRRNIKCYNPEVEKSLPKKKTSKTNNVNKELTIKRLKKDRTQKTKQVLKDISKPASDVVEPVESITKKGCDSVTAKVSKPRKGMATPKQRLARIIKIRKMMK